MSYLFTYGNKPPANEDTLPTILVNIIAFPSPEVRGGVVVVVVVVVVPGVEYTHMGRGRQWGGGRDSIVTSQDVRTQDQDPLYVKKKKNRHEKRDLFLMQSIGELSLLNSSARDPNPQSLSIPTL